MVEKIHWAETKVALFSAPTKEKSTLLAIAQRADPSGYGSFLSQKKIAFITGHDRRTVRRHIKVLVMRGELVTWAERGRKVSSDHFFIPIVARTLEELMKERQLAGLPLFMEYPQGQSDPAQGQTDPAQGQTDPHINPLSKPIIKKPGPFQMENGLKAQLVMKADRDAREAELRKMKAEESAPIAPGVRELAATLVAAYTPVYVSPSAEIVEPEAIKDDFSQQEWQKSLEQTKMELERLGVRF